MHLDHRVQQLAVTHYIKLCVYCISLVCVDSFCLWHIVDECEARESCLTSSATLDKENFNGVAPSVVGNYDGTSRRFGIKRLRGLAI